MADAGTESNTPAAASSAGHPHREDSIRDTLEAIVIAFILAFVFRAYVVEAFVIPTGSMAPTLMGEHFRVTCAQCGYRFTSDADNDLRIADGRDGNRYAVSYVTRQNVFAICPMCHHANHIPRGTTTNAGDRIVVHKYLYSVLEPQRWDVVVFKNPYDPPTNFIKRLVGLPNESIAIIDGNVHVRPATGDQSAWRIARKTERPRVQQTVWQPVYHSDFIPLDGGKLRIGEENHPWSVPWSPVDERNQPATGKALNAWQLEGRRSYRHDSAGAGRLLFDFQTMALGGGSWPWHPYNQFKAIGSPAIDPIEDVRVAATFLPDGPGLSVRLQTTARLDDPGIDGTPHTLVAEINADGKLRLLDLGRTDGSSNGYPPRELASTDVGPFTTTVARKVELWYVDQEASVWIDDRRVARWAYDLADIEQSKRRAPPPTYPRVAIGVHGAPVTLHHVEVDRDIYYTGNYYTIESGENYSGKPWAGTIIKHSNGNYQGSPINLETDQFFCLGDNSRMSFDGRAWSSVDPWIRFRMLNENTQQTGVVPRKLMMGKAFFVYYPAAYSFGQGYPSIIPDFGDMRFIH